MKQELETLVESTQMTQLKPQDDDRLIKAQ
jgi:hypothetical protein